MVGYSTYTNVAKIIDRIPSVMSAETLHPDGLTRNFMLMDIVHKKEMKQKPHRVLEGMFFKHKWLSNCQLISNEDLQTILTFLKDKENIETCKPGCFPLIIGNKRL